MNEGKTEFYKKAEASLISKGYHYYGEKDIRGKGPQHKSKPDYIAQKGQIIIIGEIKSLSVNKIYFLLGLWYRFSRMTPYVNGRNHGHYPVLGSLGCVLGQGGAVDPSAGT